ncbi:MAG: ABC transporter ATP-binding protein [Pseudomonadota bacterium]
MIENIQKAHLMTELRRIFSILIFEDKKLLWLAAIYGFGISFLTLSVPVSVQMLINSISYTASFQAVIILALFLLFLLICSGVLSGLQIYIMELFERKIYVRLSSEITLRTIYADYQFSANANRTDYINRYFDIMTLQKVVPSLITGVFGLVLQMIVGVVVVSSYHPYLLIFNVLFLFSIWAILSFWGYDAIVSAFKVSQAKYETVRHIEDIGQAYSFYGSEAHTDYGIKKSDHLIDSYTVKRISFFGHVFKQQIALLILYAICSAGLLGVGGVLVIDNQLTLGQLVASELILSTVFYNISRSGSFLTQFYEMCAALEEIYRIYQMPLESPPRKFKNNDVCDVTYDEAVFLDDNNDDEERLIRLDFQVKQGSKVTFACEDIAIQNTIIQSILGHFPPQSGRILIGDTDLRDFSIRRLRDDIIVLDQPTVIECTIREYLMMRDPDAKNSEIFDVLEHVELNNAISSLPQGLDSAMTVTGMPLSPDQVLRLKLAAAILARPSLLIVTQFFDTIPNHLYRRIFQRLQSMEKMSLIYFTNREEDDIFNARYHVKNLIAQTS